MVSLDTSKLEALKKRTEALKRSRIKFGSMGDGGSAAPPHPESDDLNVAQVLALHEFGLGVPERRVVRVVVDEKRRETAEQIADTAAQALDLDRPEPKVAEQIGERMVELMREAHGDLGDVVDRDGFTRPALDDTGAILESLQWAKEPVR